MDFNNRVKGAVTESLVKSLFEDAGYRVVPLGIEEVVRETVILSKSEYSKLDLPSQLRSLPDFLITDEKMAQAWMVEVKYRKRWDEATMKALADTLKDQAETWQNFLLILFVSEPCTKNEDNESLKNTPSSFCKIFKIRSQDSNLKVISRYDKNNATQFLEWNEKAWYSSFNITEVFTGLDNRIEDKTIQKCCDFIKKYPEILDA